MIDPNVASARGARYTGLLLDLRAALRGLRRAPFLTVAASLTLALGVATNAAVLSYVRGLLLDDPPYPAADELILIETERGGARGKLSTLEIRDLSMDGIERTFEAIQSRADDIGEATGVSFSFDRFYISRAAPTDLRIRDMVEDGARSRGLSSMRMPSGAGHDAQSIALLCPVGMIFVPSIRGISHAPEERTELPDIVNGTNVLLDTLLAIDEGGVG